MCDDPVRTRVCAMCGGRGTVPSVTFIDCPACEGIGKVLDLDCSGCFGRGREKLDVEEICPGCGGAART